MKRAFEGAEIEVIQGDIVAQPDVEAVVNAANAELLPGSGVAGAIHRAAGPGLERECRPLAPISPGQAVATGAHNLPNEYVIHTLGPVYGRDEPAAELLANCYEASLELAANLGVSLVAFPAISTGVFGYPLEEAASVSLAAVKRSLERSSVATCRFVLFSQRDLEVYERALQRC